MIVAHEILSKINECDFPQPLARIVPLVIEVFMFKITFWHKFFLQQTQEKLLVIKSQFGMRSHCSQVNIGHTKAKI